MSVAVIVIFVLFCLINFYIIYKLAKRNDKQKKKAALNCFVLFSIFFIAKWIFGWMIPDYSLFLVMVALFVNNFFGYYKNKYNHSKNFDRILHGYGSFSFALLGYYFIVLITQQDMSRFFRAIFIFVLGVALGALFELLEFSIDSKYHTETQKSLKDTDTDMLCNAIGSLIAAIVSCFIIP